MIQHQQIKERTELRQLAETLSRRLVTSWYQPIVSLSGQHIVGYEALCRPHPTSPFPDVNQLLAAAGRQGLLTAMDHLCRWTAIKQAQQLELSLPLFINVCPTTLAESTEVEGTADGLPPLGNQRITLELTERTAIDDFVRFRRVLEGYRQRGFLLAIDDLGEGYAGLRMLGELEPDFVKLSRLLVTNIERSTRRKNLVDLLVTFCHRSGATVIAEGIEREEELAWLTDNGVDLGQGYLLGRPSPTGASPPQLTQNLFPAATPL